ncbi:hypothetical protein C8R28_10892 [Nitrosomonas ureae]|uniref:Uncharacterized protein n=1 Tax=Nitrosomonas ureae TaxID=44577 RepID=A0A2T5HYD5_9PROT|nr:hypothetical protein C8R28_10892 [Nitrosomonas ureae]
MKKMKKESRSVIQGQGSTTAFKRFLHTAHGGMHTHFPASLAELNTGILTALDALLNVKQQFGYY